MQAQAIARLFAGILAAVSLAPLQAAARSQADVLVRHATVVDTERGRLVPDQAVATSGNRIVAAGNDSDVARHWSGKQTIDAKNRYLIPGLWDMHVHFGGGRN